MKESPKSNKNSLLKKLTSPRSKQFMTSSGTLATLHSPSEVKTIEIEPSVKDIGSPKSPKSPRTLFKTTTKLESHEMITPVNVENEHDGALITATGEPLQPTKVVIE